MKRALRILKETVKKVDGRYEAGLLWKTVEPTLPNNREAALKRRLNFDPALKSLYAKAINEFVVLGHAQKLTREEAQQEPLGKTWYLYHHPVFNPNKPGKCRVVFRGMSLNSSLVRGPTVAFSPAPVVALVTDNEKMFFQVRVRPEDCSALR